VTNWTDRGKHTTTTMLTKQYDFSQEPPPFLVDGIIHRSITLIYGQTTSGKSTVAASLAAALANGQSQFLGRDIANGGQPMTVGIVAGDPLGTSEYAELLVKSGAIGDGRVYVIEPDRPTRRETWGEVKDKADKYDWNFIVVDNLSSFVLGSLNDDDGIKALYEEIDHFPRVGIPVLMVAHVSEKRTEHGPSRIPMGSSYIRFGPRWWCLAYRSGGYLHLEFDGNRGTPHNIIVTEPDGTPCFDVIETGEPRRRQRNLETKAKLDAKQDYVIAKCQGVNGQQTAEKLAAKFGGSASTHAARLSDGGYGVKNVGGRGPGEARWVAANEPLVAVA
jgi:AAA domain